MKRCNCIDGHAKRAIRHTQAIKPRPMPSQIALRNRRGPNSLRLRLEKTAKRTEKRGPGDEKPVESEEDFLGSVETALLGGNLSVLDKEDFIPRLSETEAESGTDQEQEHGRQKWEFSRKSYQSEVIKFWLPSLDDIEPSQASTPGFFWDLAEERGILRTVDHSNMGYHSKLLRDWLVQAKDWRHLIWMFRDLVHLANGNAISTAFVSLARLKLEYKVDVSEIRSLEGFQCLEKQLHKRFERTADVLWSLAVILGPIPKYQTLERIEERYLFDSLVYKIRFTDRGHWSVRDVALTAWACASMCHRNIHLLMRLAQMVVQHGARRCSLNDLTSLAWAYKTLFFAGPEENLRPLRSDLCKTLAEGAKHRLHMFSPNQLIEFVSLLNTMHYYDPGLMRAALQDIRGEDSPCSASSLVAFLVAYEEILYFTANGRALPDVGIMKAIEVALVKFCKQRPGEMKTNLIANICFAFSHMRYYSEELFQALADLCTDKIYEISTEEMVTVSWTFARLGFPAKPDFLDSMNQHVMTHQAEYTGMLACNMLWALAVLQATDVSSFEVLVQQVTQCTAFGELNNASLQQLGLALLLWEMDMSKNGKVKWRESLTSPHVRQLLEEANKNIASNVTVSNFQKELSRILTRMGIPHESERKTLNGLMSIDIACKAEAQNGDQLLFAIEADGPFHFACNTYQPLGTTLVRDRLLQSQGYIVVSIPVFEFEKVPAERQEEYLARKLAHAGLKSDEHCFSGYKKAYSQASKGQYRPMASGRSSRTESREASMHGKWQQYTASDGKKTVEDLLYATSYKKNLGDRSSKIASVSPTRRKGSGRSSQKPH